jgi:hypothetical protein
MHTPPGQDDVATVTPSEGTIDYRAIARRIVWLQTQLTATRRRLEALQAHPSSAGHHADLAARVAALQTDLAQHEFEIKYWVARLDLLQPRP